MKTSVVIVALLCCFLPAAYAAGTTTTTKSEDRCLYVISVQTGNVANAGTDAKISVTFQSQDGKNQLHVSNLESWTHDHADPFEKGSLDKFEGYDRCMENNFCQMLLQSDNSGNKAGWYVDSVRIQVIKNIKGSDNAAAGLFDVHQWLALDEPPYQLYADRNVCSATGAEAGAATM